MALLTGSNKIKTAVFISGTGSNLKSLIQFSKLKKSPIVIEMIISNNAKSKGLQYANIYKIKKRVFDFKNSLSEKKIIDELKQNNISLICLAGFMKILDVLIFSKFISAEKLFGITLLILSAKPPPVMFAHPLIKLLSINFKTSFT